MKNHNRGRCSRKELIAQADRDDHPNHGAGSPRNRPNSPWLGMQRERLRVRSWALGGPYVAEFAGEFHGRLRGDACFRGEYDWLAERRGLEPSMRL